MQRIVNDIKSGNFQNLYLLYGEEGYLLRQYRDNLKNALTGGDESMNFTAIEGPKPDISALIDLAETLPFFAERRVILLENTGLFKSGGDQLANYLGGAVPDTTYFIICEQQIDKRSKLYKAAGKLGSVIEFTRQDETTLKKWIMSILRKEQRQITGQALELILSMVGDDMQLLRSEMDKLLCYTMDREGITAADVEAICIHQPQDKVFDMITAISLGRQQEALELYYDLLTMRVEPLKILALLERQFNLLLQAKELAVKGYGADLIAKSIGVPNFVAKKISQQASAFSKDKLKEALTDCVQMDQDSKTGMMNPRMAVELLIVRYSSRGNRR